MPVAFSDRLASKNLILHADCMDVPPDAGATVSGFCAGTLVRTSIGNVTVEGLRVGNLVTSPSGEERPLRWLGQRVVDCRDHPKPEEVLPVQIAANAFGTNRPARNLLVAPRCLISVDVDGGPLVSAVALVNGATIKQIGVDEVVYWHAELDHHDDLLVEGLTVASYLDTGDRGFFTSPTEGKPAHDPRPNQTSDRVLMSEPDVGALRSRLHESALGLGWSLDDEPDLHLNVDGLRVLPLVRGLTARFLVPQNAKDIWLVSPAARPCDTTLVPDARRLGVCVSAIQVLDGVSEPRSVATDDPRLSQGFHDVEPGGRRWTNGRAFFPPSLLGTHDNDVYLRIDLAGRQVPRWRTPNVDRPYDLIIEEPAKGVIRDRIAMIQGFVQSSEPLPELTLKIDGVVHAKAMRHLTSDPNAPWNRRHTSHWTFWTDATKSTRKKLSLEVTTDPDNVVCGTRQFPLRLRRRYFKPRNKLIYFIHVEKTAGTSLRKMVDCNKKLRKIFVYNNVLPETEVRQFNNDAADDLDLVFGHFAFGLHEVFVRPFRYVSIVRDPVDFVRSYYLYQKYVSNMTKFDHCLNIYDALANVPDRGFGNLFTRYFSGTRPGEPIDESRYKIAVDNIEKYFDFIGISEDAERFHKLFCKNTGTPYVALRENVTVRTIEGAAIKRADLEASLQERLKWDFLLYDFIRQRWAQYSRGLTA